MTPVTADEAEQLKELVKETDGRNWVYIAQQLGVNIIFLSFFAVVVFLQVIYYGCLDYRCGENCKIFTYPLKTYIFTYPSQTKFILIHQQQICSLVHQKH